MMGMLMSNVMDVTRRATLGQIVQIAMVDSLDKGREEVQLQEEVEAGSNQNTESLTALTVRMIVRIVTLTNVTICANWISTHANKCLRPIVIARNVQAIVQRVAACENTRKCVVRVLKGEDVELRTTSTNCSVPRQDVSCLQRVSVPGLVLMKETPIHGEDERDKFCIR